jgi:hypothetical protein
LNGPSARLCPKEVVLLFELFQPGSTTNLFFALWTPAGAGEKDSFFFDQLVGQGISSGLVVSRPVGQRFFNIGDSSLGPLDRRSTSIIGV